MLPAWATVTIVLGASLITALAALGGTWLQGRLRRSEQLRERMITECADFVTGIHQGELGIRGIIRPVELTDLGPVWQGGAKARDLAEEAEARLARVHLLLGVDSDAGKAAELRRAADNIFHGADPSNVGRANDFLGETKEALADFHRAAHDAIHRATQPARTRTTRWWL